MITKGPVEAFSDGVISIINHQLSFPAHQFPHIRHFLLADRP